MHGFGISLNPGEQLVYSCAALIRVSMYNAYPQPWMQEVGDTTVTMGHGHQQYHV